MIARADAVRIPLADRSVDLVIGSPPYVDARTYLEGGRDLKIARKCEAWIEWMLEVTAEALRVSRGLVLWVVAGKTKDWRYQPAPEGLLYRWWAAGGHCFRPVYWHRVGIPGSGSGVWYRADIEHVLCFKRPGKPDYANPTANGHAPKYAPGGDMSHRLTDGTRRNQWGGGEKSSSNKGKNGEIQKSGRPSHRVKTMREPDGSLHAQGYDAPDLANPGNLLHADLDQGSIFEEIALMEAGGEVPNLIHTAVGGGLMGHDLAHENEAPYPCAVPSFFINSHCPPGGLVLDPFVGSGSTIQAALEAGRRGIGMDLRQSQCVLSRRRIATITPGFAFT